MTKEKPAKENKTTDRYTVTEVGTILEAIRKDFKVVSEGHADLDSRMEKLEIAVHGNSDRLDMVKLRLVVVEGKASRLEDAVSKLSKDLRETRAELGETRQELKSELVGINNRLSSVEANR